MPQPNTQNVTAAAAEFLTRCFAKGETIALLLRREVPCTTIQRIVQLETVIEPRYLGWLAQENAAGANIYVAANPLRSDSRRRTKECIASVRHLYLDLDTDGETRLSSLQASDAVPPPNAVLSTSLGKYQILWRVDGFTLEQQESALKLLAVTFGGDPACTDCNRVLRLPGFLNCKYDPAYAVTVEYPGHSTWNSDDFRMDILAADAILSSRTFTARKRSSNHTNSEHDWAWVLHELARGKDAAKLTRKLASRRADKPNPLYYAQRTVDIASARLWLIEGIPADDVVTLLEVRRRFEIPIALCRARAREIAQTAQRTIAHKKIA
jgi:RepB DNA-primase from phage plasmid